MQIIDKKTGKSFRTKEEYERFLKMEESLEGYLLKKYKFYVGRKNWIAVQEFESILNKFFEYDFPYVSNHYMVIKNGEQIYDYLI